MPKLKGARAWGLGVAPLSCLYLEIVQMGSHSCVSGNKHQSRKLPAWQDTFFRRKCQG